MKRWTSRLLALAGLLLTVVPLFGAFGCGKKDEPDDPSYYKGSDFKKGPGKAKTAAGDQ
jgi:hypothetical protein